MKKIDRLLQSAYQKTESPAVHIISDGICAQCKGPCRGSLSKHSVFIIDDIPKDYVLDIPQSSIFREYHEEQEEVEVPIALTSEEEKAVQIKKSKKEDYRKMFGYG